MKFTVADSLESIPFQDLPDGELFIFAESNKRNTFMKINSSNISAASVNFVEVSSGKAFYSTPLTKVQTLKYKLIIEGVEK